MTTVGYKLPYPESTTQNHEMKRETEAKFSKSESAVKGYKSIE